MTVAGRLEGADPTDLEGLREVLGRADPEGKVALIGMGRNEIGTDALSLLPEVVSELARAAPPRVVLVTDATPMRRGGEYPKLRVEELLAGRFEVSRAVLGEGSGQLHADELATDVRMANEAGMASALVLTGASGPEEALASTDKPDYVIEHLGELRGVPVPGERDL